MKIKSFDFRAWYSAVPVFKYFAVLVVLICSSASGMPAQETQLTVVTLHGKVRILSAPGKKADLKTDKNRSLSTGDRLAGDEEIELSENAYLALVSASGATCELKKPGRYDVRKLAAGFGRGGSDISKKFSNYLLSEMIETPKSREMKYLAAVVRHNINLIDADFPASTAVMDSMITFRWYRAAGMDRYYFRLINPENNTVLMREVGDTSLTLNIDQLGLKPDISYKWYVFNPDDENFTSDSCSIITISHLTKKALLDTLADLRSGLQDSDSGLNNFILGMFFEANGLYLNALNLYNTALSFSPGVEQFNNKYFRFLIRSGMNRRAMEIQKKLE